MLRQESIEAGIGALRPNLTTRFHYRLMLAANILLAYVPDLIDFVICCLLLANPSFDLIPVTPAYGKQVSQQWI